MAARRATQESPMVAAAITPISDAARGLLRSARAGGGRIGIDHLRAHLVTECRQAGYLHVSEDGKIGRLTGLGQAYLDRLMRAH